ncbi:class I SAM-dependent methyltransferase [Candidatus Omnitrophota bacterium]
MSIQYLLYLLCKPSHSYKHKRLKNKSTSHARQSHEYDELIKEISEYTGFDRRSIESKHKQLVGQVGQKNYDLMSEEELVSFYRETEYHFYAAPMWNASCGRTSYLVWSITSYLRSNKYKTILDFGAGGGELCMALAQQGFSVHYVDVNKALIDFSRWRFKRRNLDIKIIANDEVNAYTFDAVISFDVFEHLKNLPQKIKDISRLIKPGGSLVFSIELSGGGLHLEENKVYSNQKMINEILEDSGLTFDWRFKGIFFYKRR